MRPTRMPSDEDDQVDLEGWTLSSIEEYTDQLRKLVIRSAQEALEWLFSDENERIRPSVYFSIFWNETEPEDPLTMRFNIPFNEDSMGPGWEFSFDDIIKDMVEFETDEPEKLKKVIIGLENVCSRLKGLAE